MIVSDQIIVIWGSILILSEKNRHFVIHYCFHWSNRIFFTNFKTASH